jgi:hypothetical protein
LFEDITSFLVSSLELDSMEQQQQSTSWLTEICLYRMNERHVEWLEE